MSSFVRKNLLVISGVFFTPEACNWQNCPPQPPPSPPPQPASAICVVRYFAPSPPPPVPCPPNYCPPPGVFNETIINLTLGTDGVTWSGTWDSSLAGPGRVDWLVYSEGGVVAAAQGSFVISANYANRTVT